MKDDYLKLHPATALWWAQRDRCRACAHHFRSDDSRSERCRAAPAATGYREFRYCIDARGYAMPCGPDAKQFTPKETP